MPSTRLGRVRDDGNRSNEVVLNDSTVSRFHAQIDLAGADWVINDRQSNNGVWVNDARVTEQRLAPGDVVRMGGVLLRFETLDGG
ncbi:MAG: FHA domain-containing protein [Polyangiales bacterium]